MRESSASSRPNRSATTALHLRKSRGFEERLGGSTRSVSSLGPWRMLNQSLVREHSAITCAPRPISATCQSSKKGEAPPLSRPDLAPKPGCSIGC